MKENLPFGYSINNNGPEPIINIETIPERNKKILWEESGTMNLEYFGEKLSVKARRIEVEPAGTYRWQYGLFYSDDSVIAGPASYINKEDALSDGVNLAEKEIRTLQDD